MRYSETPLWWRVLVLAITLAILWVIYAVVAGIVAGMTDAMATATAVVIMGAGIAAWIIGARRDRRLKLRDEASEGGVLEGRAARRDLGSDSGIRPGE